ncbi:MAG TPA: ADP-ribosylglycohydrolase family protein [Chloroflexota bacterium]|nr:ADP-ribosylglycohydrolase family protein [Chloroflexota bacterium]
MTIPADYAERVYAGVLGKLIGVYLGRPFEGWTHERIMAELGEISYYIQDPRGLPLIVTDDDISGTFTFLRALADHGNRLDLTAAQIGATWMNYIIEGRTILWWGGLGNSTEHTAFLRLKRGIPAPQSGSAALNGKVVSEQIGSQIFIDGWAMAAPGDPALAADLARRAASVSHDGEAVYGAQVLAAMEAGAFVEPDLNQLIDTALTFIPRDSLIARLIDDVREWRRGDNDWRRTRKRIGERYGYDRYGGNCHMIPNHALIHLGLLYGGDDLQRALLITNTSGWDTDCNSGNVGCFLGIKNGLAGIDAGPDWRGPIADRLYLPTADGGRAITDALTEAYHVVNSGRALAGESPVAPKHGARFHFDLPGSFQGFQPDHDSPFARPATLENVAGHSRLGCRSLAIHYHHLSAGQPARIATPTFIPFGTPAMRGYTLIASPTLYSGQTVRAELSADEGNAGEVTCQLYARRYGAGDAPVLIEGPEVTLRPGSAQELVWRLPDTQGTPIALVGIAVRAEDGAQGTVYLDYLTWGGAPTTVLGAPPDGGDMWRNAWVDALDRFDRRLSDPYRLVQNHGTGMLIQGTREWRDYEVSTTFKPHLAESCGLGVRVQGLGRYYAVLLGADGKARMVKELAGQTVLAEITLPWELGRTYTVKLEARGPRLRGWVDDQLIFDGEDSHQTLDGGGVALICTEGRVDCGAVRVTALGGR